jgi:RNA polymerase sigma factor for flagellar operon FliA
MAMSCASPLAQDLIDQGQGLVRSLAVRIHKKLPRNVDMDDLIAYGQLGLVEAARDFDPARGNQFSTYAYYRVRGAIYDGLSKMSWFGRNHYEHVRYEQMANETLRASNEDSTPQAQEGQTESRWFRDVSWSLLVVYLAVRNAVDEDGENTEGQLADHSTPTPSSVLMDRETKHQLRELIDALPTEEAALIRGTYFEGLTLEETGRKMGISKSWASRLHARSLQRLARSLQRSTRAHFDS